MSYDPNANPNDAPRSTRSTPSGSQGASRGGRQPDETPDDSAGTRTSWDDARRSSNASQDQRARNNRGGFWSRLPGMGAGGSGTLFGVPVTLIYLIGASVIGLIFIGAVCSPTTTVGSVAGQVKALSTDRQVSTLAGAQVILRGSKETYTTVSADVAADATGDAAYNYRFENVPPGTYTMAVTPPAGSNLQPESDITLKVESGQMFPQSVMLLAEGLQKPRPLAPSEVEPRQVGYLNERGERVTYQQGSGFDTTDALLLYLLWRNPPTYGYGAPPIIVNSPGSTNTSGYNYRADPPPTTTRTGQTVTQRPPSVPGQGSTRPSSSSSSTGPGPSTSSGSNTSSSSSSSSTTTKPSTSSSSNDAATNRSSSPSQGASRPSSSSSSSSPSRSSSSGSRSSGGGRR